MFSCDLALFLSVSQPPPQISDKQLEEREHTIEQWKGRTHCPPEELVGNAVLVSQLRISQEMLHAVDITAQHSCCAFMTCEQ